MRNYLCLKKKEEDEVNYKKDKDKEKEELNEDNNNNKYGNYINREINGREKGGLMIVEQKENVENNEY